MIKIKFRNVEEALQALIELHEETRKWQRLVNGETLNLELIRTLPLTDLEEFYENLMPDDVSSQWAILIYGIERDDQDDDPYIIDSVWGCSRTAKRIAKKYQQANPHLQISIARLSDI